MRAYPRCTLLTHFVADTARIAHPPGPRFFPILYHSIADEVPSPNQRLVRTAYACWILAATGYTFNLLTMSIAYFGGAKTTLSNWFFALLVSSIGVPASWLAWYQGIYNAAQTESSLLAYGRFFGHMSVHILLCVWMALALPKVGQFSAGIFTMISWFSAKGERINKVCGFFSIANIGLWGLCGLLSLGVLQQAAVRFRAGGGVTEMRRQSRLAAAAARVANSVPGV